MKKQILSMGLAAALLLGISGCADKSKTESIDTAATNVLTEAKTTQYFTDEAVTEADMQAILEAGVNAPSGMNKQPWHFTAVTDKDTVQQIADAMSAMMPQGAKAGSENVRAKAGVGDAPLTIFISCEDGSELDAGLACQNMSAQAQLLGYGTKILTSPTVALSGENKSEYDELLDIPEGQSVAAVLIIGVPDTSVDESVDGVTGASVRNAFDEMVTIK